MSNSKILVTGAPGNVGSEVVYGLQRLGVPFRVGAYDIESAQKTFGAETDIVPFNFLNPQTYENAFTGIEHLFLVRPPALSNVARDIAPAIRVAVEMGVKHIVFLSIQGVENNRVVPHYKIEQAILETGIDYTFLRASFFMQNLATTHRAEIRDEHKIIVPVGIAKTSFIDVRDIAAVAVLALTDDAHRNQKYTLTGAEALDYYQVAEKLSHALSQPITYVRPSVNTFLRRQKKQGQKLGYSLVVTALYTITRLGNAKTVTDDVLRLLGRAPISFDQFAHDYASSWRPTPILV
ncbi:MAG: SDR family oxidoreductase [bacterium]|nr:SDR family oxidoreductase [bacterium]